MGAELQRATIESEYQRVATRWITADEAASVMGVSRQSASKMLWRLVNRGVLEAKTRRGFRGRPATEYKLVDDWQTKAMGDRNEHCE